MHDISSEMSLPKMKQTHLSQLPPIYEMLLSLNCLIFLLDLLKCPCLSRWGAQNCTQHSRFGITSAEERRRTIFLTYPLWSSYCCPEHPVPSWLWGCVVSSAWDPPGPLGHSAEQLSSQLALSLALCMETISPWVQHFVTHLPYWPWNYPLGHCTGDWPPSAGLRASGHNRLSLQLVQPGFCLPHCALVEPRLHQFICEDAMGGSIKSLPEVKISNIRCFLLVLWASDLILKGYRADQLWVFLPKSMLTWRTWLPITFLWFLGLIAPMLFQTVR